VFLVVRKPDLGVAVLAEEAARLDHGLDDDRVELAGGDADALAAQHADRHRVAIGTEVAIEAVRLADVERDGTQKVDERAVVERIGYRRLLRLTVLDEDSALGEELEVALDVARPLVLVL
jgi:hypothetical protein